MENDKDNFYVLIVLKTLFDANSFPLLQQFRTKKVILYMVKKLIQNWLIEKR